MLGKHFMRLTGGALILLTATSCSLDPFFESHLEQYTKAFLRDFGRVNADQDWSMATSADVDVNVGDGEKNVKIYIRCGDIYYKVADLEKVSGVLKAPVHMPKGCNEVLVEVDGVDYYGTLGKMVVCNGSAQSRGVPNWNYSNTENTNPPKFTATVNDYKVTVKHTTHGNDGGEYQIFNTQQMAPVVSHKVWGEYYSMTKSEVYSNTEGTVGLLPESGVFNRTKAEMDETLAGKEILTDFKINVGSNGKFTIYPYYCGTSIIHTLGVYPIVDGQAVLGADGKPIKLPIMRDKDPGDMQINPRFNGNIAYIRVYDKDWNEISYDNPLTIYVGESFTLNVRLYDSGKNPIDYDDDFKHTYHSRITYHAWIDEELDDDGVTPKNPEKYHKEFVTVTPDGTITGKLSTAVIPAAENGKHMYWMQTGIATGLENMHIDGVDYNFPIVVKDPSEDGPVDPIPGGTTDDRPVTGVTRDVYLSDQTTNCEAVPASLKSKWVDGSFLKYFDHDGSGNYAAANYIFNSSKFAEFAQDLIALYYSENSSELNVGEWIDDVWTTCDLPSRDDYKLLSVTCLSTDNPWWFQVKLHFGEVDKSESSSSVKSRVSLSESGFSSSYQDFLTYDNSVGWKDVNQAWSRYMTVGDEVVSYPVDLPMLARSRGYDVELTMTNGSPYTGQVGMYIEINKEVVADPQGQYTIQDVANPYTLYSDKRYNEFGNLSMVSFAHPKSNRIFLSFEDMNLTHKGPGEGGDVYKEYEKSSDRDLNDLIFFIDDIQEIEGEGGKKLTPTVQKRDDGFSWLWVLEDLGSTGDFDFNDVIIRISDITTTIQNYMVDDDNNQIPDGDPTYTRKVTFSPLAAGGTLPIYVHFRYSGVDYTLEPGEFNLTDASGRRPTGLEYHKWFGRHISSEAMLNTGNNMSTTVYPDNDSKCVLIVPKNGFTLNIAGGDHNKDAQSNTIFYITVNGDEDYKSFQNIDMDRMDEVNGAYLIPLPEKGAAAQSFIIVEGATASGWQWPKETMHILSAYPRFKSWVENPDVNWMSERMPNTTFYLSK